MSTTRNALTSDLFPRTATSKAVAVHLSGIEIHHSLGTGERYHVPLRHVFCVRRTRHPSLHLETWLHLSLKGMNNTMALRGLIPTILVFGELPYLHITSAAHNMN